MFILIDSPKCYIQFIKMENADCTTTMWLLYTTMWYSVTHPCEEENYLAMKFHTSLFS